MKSEELRCACVHVQDCCLLHSQNIFTCWRMISTPLEFHFVSAAAPQPYQQHDCIPCVYPSCASTLSHAFKFFMDMYAAMEKPQNATVHQSWKQYTHALCVYLSCVSTHSLPRTHLCMSYDGHCQSKVPEGNNP